MLLRSGEVDWARVSALGSALRVEQPLAQALRYLARHEQRWQLGPIPSDVVAGLAGASVPRLDRILFDRLAKEPGTGPRVPRAFATYARHARTSRARGRGPVGQLVGLPGYLRYWLALDSPWAVPREVARRLAGGPSRIAEYRRVHG